MTTTFHSVVQFEHKSGLPKDRMSNSWTFQPSGADDAAKMQAINDVLETFYNDRPGGGGSPLSNFLSTAISRTAVPVVKHYAVDGHESGGDLGSPLDVVPFSASLGAPSSGSGLPAEVACCLSHRTAYGVAPEFAGGGSRPRSRRRGRVYLGPLSTAAIETMTADGRCVLSEALRLCVVAAAHQLMNLEAAVDWMSWSRTEGSVGLVIQAWVDDAPDTQRRRGEDPSGRLVVDHV